jgi:lysyl endopeptidase
MRAAVLALLASMLPAAALGGVPVNIVQTDLKPLIRAGLDSPVQFAVLVPHAVSAASGGSWSTADGRATWRYAVEVRSAVSLSFHATRSSLPDSATLVVRGAKTTMSYRARDLHRGELWSRIQPGEALQFTLTVAAEDRSKVSFSIVSLQAGYRSLGPGVQDHPYYRELKAQQAAASGNASCVTNYACKVTAANRPAGSATVALLIGNLYQCTGSLINDVPGDNMPYVLTARHCETGHLGGGDPGAASAVTVYWDASTACGAALGSIYDTSLPTQTGAQTRVEQQDVWLIELDVNPVVSDAQFAGFNAAGGAVQGGYTIHHAEGYDKQFTGWFGQAAALQESAVLGTTYVSNFWETVNQIGNIGPGASGSGLFDQNNRLVGSLSLGRTTNDPSGYGACPLAKPPNPNGSNGVADFTALASVWHSTADTTSTTGKATLQSILDPAHTGILAEPSAPVANVTFSASTETLSFGQPMTLTWSAPGATRCTAGGGVAGDGWSGLLAASGSQSVTEAAPGVLTYTLSCAYAGGRTAKASVTVTWLGPLPQVQFNVPFEVWTTTPATLSWTSNVAPCSISGGGLSLTNLPASGTTTTTQATATDVTYALTCGPANNNETLGGLVQYVTPSLVFNANGTDRLLGQTFFLQWVTAADVCTPSGGAANDGWANTEFTGVAATSALPFYPKVTTLGTYTYTLTCSTGSVALSQSVTVTFENNAPYVTASLSTPSVTFSDSPADYVTITYDSNLSTCTFSSIPGIPVISYVIGSMQSPPLPQGLITLAPYESGTYQLSISCNPADLNPSVTFPPMTLTVLPPAPPTAAITFNPGSVLAGQSFTAAWSSTNAADCTLTGGIPGGLWGETQTSPPTGYDTETGVAGQYTFGLSCSSIDPSTAPAVTQAVLTIVALSATLTASATSVTNGDSFTLTWSSSGATGCTTSGGGANGTPWTGPVGPSGTQTQTATTNGTFTYSLVCSGGNESTTPQQATIKVSALSSGTGASNSAVGGGGGGAMSALEVALLAALLALSRTVQPVVAAGRRRAA